MSIAPLEKRLACAALFLLLTIAGCSRGEGVSQAQRLPVAASSEGPPSVLLVTIDTWRWDYVGASGKGLVETPRIDALAREGLYIQRLQSTCPLTTPAHATILTGLLPSRHGVRDNLHFSLKAGVTTLADSFRKAGYGTAALVSAAPLRRAYGLDRGFDLYDDEGILYGGEDSTIPASRAGGATVERALSWLKSQPQGKKVFLWVHLYEPHAPYEPPSPYRERYGANPYAGEVAYCDELAGRLFDAVRADAARRWIVALTADHGEALGDHGEKTHGLLLYGSTVDVPLVLWDSAPLPKGAGRGPFGLVDLAPTLVGLAGLGAFPCDGVAIWGGSSAPRWLAAESAYAPLSLGLAPPVRLRRGSLAYLDQGGAPEVYDLGADPGEARDLGESPEGQSLAREAVQVRPALFGAAMEKDLARGTLSLSPGELQALKGLGYIGGGAGAKKFQRTDLRAFVREFVKLQGARSALEAGRYAEAVGIYQDFLTRYPGAPPIHQELGTALLRWNRLGDAEASFSRALQMDPSDAVAALNLGNLRLMRGDYRSAERFFLQSLRAEEGQPEAHLNLGLLYANYLKRPGEAREHLERFLVLAPDDPEAPQVRGILGTLGTGR